MYVLCVVQQPLPSPFLKIEPFLHNPTTPQSIPFHKNKYPQNERCASRVETTFDVVEKNPLTE